MDLGVKIKEARLAAGLSQRQLCGQQLTRNMLSQIENGSARPSMKTLGYLAERLGKPISWFLEEKPVDASNLEALEQARTALALGDTDALRRALDKFQAPDPVFFQEHRLLEFLWRLNRAEEALKDRQLPYAIKLLREALELDGLYITRQHRRRCRVLLGLAGGSERLEWDPETMLVLAAQAETPERRIKILDAAEFPGEPGWNRLRAEALMDLGRFEEAEQCCLRLPRTRQVLTWLECCRRELGDYKGAYEYAVALREGAYEQER